MISKLTNSEGETLELAMKTWKDIQDGAVVCLYGDLGSGKTTFMKGLAQSADIQGFRVKSPTYTYIREYKRKENSIFHIDLYRLEEIDELLWREIEELMENPKNIIVIEWAERMEQYLPIKRINIRLEYKGPDSRQIIIEND